MTLKNKMADINEFYLKLLRLKYFFGETKGLCIIKIFYLNIFADFILLYDKACNYKACKYTCLAKSFFFLVGGGRQPVVLTKRRY